MSDVCQHGVYLHIARCPVCDEDRIAALEKENERLRDTDWERYIEITERWLDKYPPDIFTGVSGDPGPLFVVAVRKALKALKEGEG